MRASTATGSCCSSLVSLVPSSRTLLLCSLSLSAIHQITQFLGMGLERLALRGRSVLIEKLECSLTHCRRLTGISDEPRAVTSIVGGRRGEVPGGRCHHRGLTHRPSGGLRRRGNQY